MDASRPPEDSTTPIADASATGTPGVPDVVGRVSSPWLGDDDVSRVPAITVVELMGRAVSLAERGELDAPPRIDAPLSGDRMVFTIGGTADHVGFRVYGVGGFLDALSQVVLVFERRTGRLLGGVVGPELGRRRTGGLGALACQLLSRPDAHSLGLIGSGPQAWTHLWAVNAVRRLERVAVYSRNPQGPRRMAERARVELGLNATAAGSAEEAVVGADLVTLATTSDEPVIDAEWIGPGCHVASLGPKGADQHELPIDLVSRSSIIATDSLRQITASPGDSVVSTSAGQIQRVRSLGSLMGSSVERGPRDVTLFLSVGLAGTEVLLAADLLARLAATPAADPGGMPAVPRPDGRN